MRGAAWRGPVPRAQKVWTLEVSNASLCAQVRPEFGVYLLGAIEPARRGVVEGHLAECPRCQEEIAVLAGLPGLLRRVPPGEAKRLLAGRPGGVMPGLPVSLLLRRVARTRRRRRRMAAAAVVLIAGLAAAVGCWCFTW